MKPTQPYRDNFPLVIPCGNDFFVAFTFYKDKATREPRDLSGATIKAQAKERRAIDAPLLFQFNVSTLLNVNPGFGIVMNRIIISIDHNTTRAIKVPTGYWDILLIEDSVRTYAGGLIVFNQTGTDPAI